MLLYLCVGELCMMKSCVLQQHVGHDIDASNDVLTLQYQVPKDEEESK